MSPQFIRIFWWNVARTVRRHRLLALFNVLSIALGIAVFLAIRIANESATRAFSASVDLVAGKAHLEVRGDVDELLWPEIARQPGVAAVTGVVETLVTLPDWPGEYLHIVGVDVISGAAFQTVAFTTDAGRFEPGRWLGTAGGVAVTAEFAKRRGVSVGGHLRAMVDGRAESLTVLAILEGRELPIPDSCFAAMDIGWAQELVQRPGKLTALQVLLRDPSDANATTDALQKLAPALSVGPPQMRSEQVGKMLGAFQLNLTALSMVSLLVGVFLIYNTVSTSVARRRVQIGILRALGLTSGQVRALFLGEALLYAVPGVLLGTAGGVLLAQKLSGAVGQTITSLYTLVNVERLWLEPRQFAIAAFYGVASALVGAWGPAAEASRVEPVDALRRGVEKPREGAMARGWWLGGILSLGMAALCAWWALAGGPRWIAFGASLFVLLASAGFAPAVLLGMRAAVGRVASTTILILAARRVVRGLRRSAITVAALGAAVAMFISLVVMTHSFRISLDAWLGRGVVADLFIAPAANERLGQTTFLPPRAAAWVRARPEVAAVDTYRELSVAVNGERAVLAVIEGEYRKNLSFLDGDDVSAMASVFAGEAVVVTEPFSRRFHVGAGDRIAVETPRGAVTMRVAGVYADYTRDQGSMVVSRGWFERYWDDARVMSLIVYLRPGASGVDEAFRSEFSDEGQFSINSSRSLRARIMQIFEQTFAVTHILRTVAILVAVAGVFLTMTTLVTERRRELALLRALGGGPRFVGGLVLAEAALLGLCAGLLGVAAGVPLAMVMTWVVNPAFFGWTIQLHLPWSVLAWTPVWITLAALGSAWWPAQLARRVEIAEALHEE